MIRLLALLLLASPVAAQERPDARPGPWPDPWPDRVEVLLSSLHVNPTWEFEQVNPGLFLTWEDRPLDWTLGTYRNSYGRTSVTALAALPVRRWAGGEAALFLGIGHYPGDAERFRVHLGEWIPLGGLQIRQGPVFVQLMPSDGLAADAVIAAGLTIDLPRR